MKDTRLLNRIFLDESYFSHLCIMRHTSTLIIGQGLCGSWLSYWLNKYSADFLVLDEATTYSSSKIAAGIINPVTGRRMAKTWMADELMPFAETAYADFGKQLDNELITAIDILDFFSAPDRKTDFEKRAAQFEQYLQWPKDEEIWQPFFNYYFGFGIISPAWQVNVQQLLSRWKVFLQQHDKLVEDVYDPTSLIIKSKGISYKNISADRIIFCDGVAAIRHDFFVNLPFSFNKGEALIVSIPELPANFIYKKNFTITPWQDGLFWVGSNYDRDFSDNQPTEKFRQETTGWLKQFLKLPFTIENHLAALRPTTVERRPFVGFHPSHPMVGLLNGMGTKGVSLAPFLAKQLAENILFNHSILPETSLKRHARVLSR